MTSDFNRILKLSKLAAFFQFARSSSQRKLGSSDFDAIKTLPQFSSPKTGHFYLLIPTCAE
ncbi:hypothetical protein GCM10007901_25440 [Dyella acidisoli]|uniref:Uncharacterized protein n=1 Tax=Dyella acidisoli TaxID=1867834 RepID=A0ABQ5XRD5_9GAMM|nr:hypothetical protein GCM10007901_25440 [Dyella acidisoli]